MRDDDEKMGAGDEVMTASMSACESDECWLVAVLGGVSDLSFVYIKYIKLDF